MTLPLRLLFTRSAVREIKAAHEWWVQNRDEAPDLLRNDRAEVEPRCARCKAPLKIVRRRGEPLGAIIQINCTKNENHLSTHYLLAPHE